MTEESQETNQTPRDLRLPSALIRTALSSEQTLMSWVRTSLSMFTFGFAIAQFFQFLAKQQEVARISVGPRWLGITLISVGIVVLVVATREHMATIRRLQEKGLPSDSEIIFPMGSVAAIFTLGLAALTALFLGWQL
jgi:putative membrane protein